MKVTILETTDKHYIGQSAETDLFSIKFENNEKFEITGRIHYGNGRWRLWNSNYIMEIEEIKELEENI